jgi:hypothetical protein
MLFRMATRRCQKRCSQGRLQLATVGHVSTLQTVANRSKSVASLGRLATVGHVSTLQTVANRSKRLASLGRLATVGHVSMLQTVANRSKRVVSWVRVWFCRVLVQSDQSCWAKNYGSRSGFEAATQSQIQRHRCWAKIKNTAEPL